MQGRGLNRNPQHRQPSIGRDDPGEMGRAPSRCNHHTNAAAGGAAHLAGVISAYTWLPVLGVPIQSSALHGLDSLLSIAQMPGGIPVGTLAIGSAGAKNAALLAAAILALSDKKVRQNLQAFRKKQTEAVLAAKLPK